MCVRGFYWNLYVQTFGVKRCFFGKSKECIYLVNPQGTYPQTEMPCCWSLSYSQGRSQAWREWWSQFSKCKVKSKPDIQQFKKTGLWFALYLPYPSVSCLCSFNPALLSFHSSWESLQPLKFSCIFICCFVDLFLFLCLAFFFLAFFCVLFFFSLNAKYQCLASADKIHPSLWLPS